MTTSEKTLFAICEYDGRYIEGEPELVEEFQEALADWVKGHRGVKCFDERPEGWPEEVEGVRSNGHFRVVMNGKPYCGGCATLWPCEDYSSEAAKCPENGLGLAYPGKA